MTTHVIMGLLAFAQVLSIAVITYLFHEMSWQRAKIRDLYKGLVEQQNQHIQTIRLISEVWSADRNRDHRHPDPRPTDSGLA